MENIETVPLITSLNSWVEELPLEHRSEAYKFAESFLCVGAMYGALAGMLGALGSLGNSAPEKSEGDKQKEYIVYLQKKQKEHQS